MKKIYIVIVILLVVLAVLIAVDWGRNPKVDSPVSPSYTIMELPEVKVKDWEADGKG